MSLLAPENPIFASEIPLLAAPTCKSCGCATDRGTRLCCNCEADYQIGRELSVMAGAVNRIEQ